MARLLIDQRRVTVCLSALEKLEALHFNVTIPQTAVIATREVPDGLAEVRGLALAARLPAMGTGT